MTKTKRLMKLKTFLRGFGAIAILLTIIPFFAVDYWWIRIFDFPHLQLTSLTLLALISYTLRFEITSRADYVFVIALSLCFAYQFTKIYPYTSLASRELPDASDRDQKKDLSVYIANVLQTNEDKDLVLQSIASKDPDIVLLLETNAAWKNHVSGELNAQYDYFEGIALDNTYGMLLYSRFPLSNSQVRFLVDDSIPSIHTRVLLPGNDTVQLYAIHPTPPMPQHNPKSTSRDAEMMEVALASYRSEYPVLVIGDFNDVAWSQTTRLFEKVSTLLDPRRGRGLYCSYNAKYWLLRWPLDHVFTSGHFRNISLVRGDKIGSDHFPLYAELVLEPGEPVESALGRPDAELIEKAEEIIARSREDD